MCKIYPVNLMCLMMINKIYCNITIWINNLFLICKTIKILLNKRIKKKKEKRSNKYKRKVQKIIYIFFKKKKI